MHFVLFLFTNYFLYDNIKVNSSLSKSGQHHYQSHFIIIKVNLSKLTHHYQNEINSSLSKLCYYQNELILIKVTLLSKSIHPFQSHLIIKMNSSLSTSPYYQDQLILISHLIIKINSSLSRSPYYQNQLILIKVTLLSKVIHHYQSQLIIISQLFSIRSYFF